MKNLILAAFTNLLVLCAFAQDEKHENHFRTIEPINAGDVTLTMEESHAQMQFCQAKFKIKNNTADYIVINSEKVEFQFDHGTFYPKKKQIVIAPKKTVTEMFKVSGGEKFHVEKYAIQWNGFNKVPAKGEVQSPENFALPASKNDVEAGPFMCKVAGEISQKTQETVANFKCSYTGEKIGILDATKASVKLESGQEFANTNTGGGKLKGLMGGDHNLVFPGDKKKITLIYKVPAKVTDMQFANMEVVWHETFMESTASTIKIPNANFELDPGKTAGHNQ